MARLMPVPEIWVRMAKSASGCLIGAARQAARHSAPAPHLALAWLRAALQPGILLPLATEHAAVGEQADTVAVAHPVLPGALQAHTTTGLHMPGSRSSTQGENLASPGAAPRICPHWHTDRCLLRLSCRTSSHHRICGWDTRGAAQRFWKLIRGAFRWNYGMQITATAAAAKGGVYFSPSLPV